MLQFWDQIRPHTMLDEPRAWQLWQACRQARTLPGEAAEIGVFRGGSALLMALADLSRPLHLFDTFTGTPTATCQMWESYFLANPTFDKTSLEQVKSLFTQLEHVHFHPGVFPETWTDELADRQFAVLHFDADTYQCLHAALERFWPRLVPGGIVLIDDWGRPETPGVVRAAMEFLADKRYRLDADPEVHYTAILRKP